MEETVLTSFLIGLATAYFLLHAYQLFLRKDSSRLQRVLAVIFVQWAAFNLKDLFLTVYEHNNQNVQDIVILIDGTCLIGYTCLIYELIRPGWASFRKVLWMLLAYIPFFASWFLWHDELVIRCYITCLFLAGAVIFLLWLREARRYVRYIRDNYSNIDEINISWLRVVAWFFITCQLLWVVISIISHPLTDCLYYILSIILWQITLEHVLRQKPLSIEITDPDELAPTCKYSFAKTLPAIIEEEELYLNPTLSIKELASHIGTNRTYLSKYFTHIQQTTFYDYINRLRIEKKSIPLMQCHPEYTLEKIAAESGFQSLSTFYRSFLKLKGIKPSEYRKRQ